MSESPENYDLISCRMFLISENGDYHCEFPEFWAVIDGSITLKNYEKPFRQNTVAFLMPGDFYFFVHAQCTILCISVNPSSFINQLPSAADFNKDSIVIEHSENLFFLMTDYGRRYFSENTSAFSESALFFTMVDNISNQVNIMTSSKLDFSGSVTEKQRRLLTAIDIYMQEKLHNPPSLGDTAKHFSMTAQYISWLFKTCCHTTYTRHLAYLKEYRANTARTFCSENTAPSYVPSFSILNAATALVHLQNQSSTPTSPKNDTRYHAVTADATHTQSVFPVWKQLINLGYADDLNNPKILRQLAYMQERLHFRYGRICHIFSLVISYTSGNHILYDYSRIFYILDTLTAHGMYPFIELGNKNFRIPLSLHDTLMPNTIKDSANHFDNVLKLLPDFICACINRYGYHYVKHWKFEICAPEYEAADINVDFSLKRYADYFIHIKACIQHYVPECQIGGPGFNNWDSPEIFPKVLKLFYDNHMHLDFITAYLYPLALRNRDISLSSDIHILEKRMEILMTSINRMCPERRLWITEFNSNLSARNSLNDSSYQSAFIAHSLMAAVEKKVYAMGYYLMSDIPLRYADTLDMLFGGFGLFTDTGIPKPSFHTFHMFNTLGTDLLVKTNRCMITSSDSTSFQCLLYHYEHPKDYFCHENAHITDFLTPDNLFIHTAADTWDIVLTKLPEGYYLVKEYTVTPSLGNLMFLWHKMSCIAPVKSNDLKFLIHQSEPHSDFSCIMVTEQTPLSLHYTLMRQEVKLVTIEYFHPI